MRQRQKCQRGYEEGVAKDLHTHAD